MNMIQNGLNLGWIPMSVAMGIGATVAIDLWAQLLQRAAGVPSMDWGMVGRWFMQLTHGRSYVLTHDAAPVPYERHIGWGAHYAVGITYGLMYMGLVQITSLSVSLSSALAFGLITVLAPWLILQPGLGKGWFAAKTPNPRLTRVLNIGVHLVFGAGLYLVWRALG